MLTFAVSSALRTKLGHRQTDTSVLFCRRSMSASSNSKELNDIRFKLSQSERELSFWTRSIQGKERGRLSRQKQVCFFFLGGGGCIALRSTRHTLHGA